MELLSTTTVTLPYAARRGNFSRAYFQNQPSLCNKHAEPLKQKSLPKLKSSWFVLDAVTATEKPFVCKATDGGRITWVDTKVPEIIRPYVQLCRIEYDVGIWLQAFPFFWGVTLATPPGMLPDFKLIGLFYLIGFFVHISCCVSNDLIDFKYDRKVERSKTRPLAAGTITPFQGWLFWGLTNAFLVPLVLKLNKLSIALSVVEQVLWIGYPFMKRITYWPAAYLGVVHNWGVLLGYAAVKGHLNDWRIFLPVHIAGICWTLIYDTIYAHQDKNDDVKAGVKSTAVLFGDSTKSWLLGFATIIIGGLLIGGNNAQMGWPFYLSMIPAAGHLLWQIFSTDYSNKFDCFMNLVSNKWFGAIIFVGMLLGRVYY